MKSKFIRVLTFVLCLAMLLTSMSVFTVSAAGNVITPTGFVNALYTFGGGNQWLIWLSKEGTFPSDPGVLYANPNLPVTVYDAKGNIIAQTGDGNLWATLLDDGGEYLCPLLYGNYTTGKADGPDAGTIIKIDAGTYADPNNASAQITIENDICLQRQADGSWSLSKALYFGKLSTVGAETNNENPSQLYLKGTDGLKEYKQNDDTWTVRMVADNAESGVFFNNTRVNNGQAVFKYNGTNNRWFAEGFTATTATDRLVIKGSFTCATTGSKIILEEATFEWNGTKWVDVIQYTTYTGTLTVKGAETENNGFNRSWLKGSESLNGAFANAYDPNLNGGWNQLYLTPADGAENGAFLNDKKVNVTLQQYNWTKQYYFIEGLNAQTVGDVFELKGTFVNEASATKIVFENTRFIWNGTFWVDDVVDTTVYNDMTITELYNATCGTSADSWTFNFKVDGTWPSNAADFEEYTDPIVYINDTALDPSVIQTFRNKSGDYAYFMLKLWGSLTDHVDPAVGTTVTIKAGKIKYAADESVGVKITEDFVIRYNGSEWVNPNEKVYNELTLGAPLSSVDFRCEAPNVPGSWDYNYAGLTVTLNGNPFTNFEFKKPNDVYFVMHDVTLNVGDVVVISGQSDCTSHPEQAGIKLTAPATYVWNGTAWETPDTTVYDQLAFNGFAWSPNVPGADWWDLYLKVDGTIPGEANVTNFANTLTLSVKNSSGVTVLDHATPVLLSYQSHEDGTLLFRLPVSALPAASVDVGSLFTLHAGKAKSTTDGVNGIEITKDYTIEYTGSGFANYVAYNYTDLSILNFIKREGNGIYFATDNDYPDNWDKYVGLQISLNGGEKINKYVGNAGRGSKQMVIDLTDAEWATVTAGSTLTIYAGEAKSIDGADYDGDGVADAIRLVETCTFVYKNGGFELYVPSADVTINDVKDGGYNASANYWDIYLKASVNGLVGNWDVAYNDIVVLVNGEVLNGGYNIKYTPGNDINVFINTGYVTPTIGTKITLKAGISNASNGGLAMNLTADFTMVWDGSVMVAEGNYIDRTTYTVYTGDLTVAGAQIPGEYKNSQLYLKGSAGLAGYLTNGSWAYKLKPLDAQSGIFVNGNRVGGQILKYDDTPNYWFAEGFTANEGDTVTIKGTFYNDDQQVKVVIAEGSFVWNGNGYDVALTTTVEKDVNADSEVNALDVVWMTRYLADPAVGISNKGDINGDGTVDATDLRILRRYVLGINIVVVNGVAQGTPYYAGGETTKVAYVAPQLGSFDPDSKTLTFKSDEEIDRLMDEYAAVGFTHIVTEHAAYLYDNTADYVGQQLLYRYYEEAAERGMKVIVVSGYMDYLRTYEGDLSAIVYKNGNTWKNIVDDIIYNQSKYEAFAGFMLGDEPTDAQEKNYIEIIEYVRENHPDVLVWYAAFPNYVSSTGVADYADYVKTHGVANGHFMYDNYALRTKTSWFGSSTDYYLETYWFTNLLTVAELGRDYGFTTGVTMQSVALQESGGGLFQNTYQTRPIKKKEDIGFQVYTALAYGMKELDFFTYMNHWSDEMVDDTAMIKTDGTQNPSYGFVRDVYNNIKAMEAALLNFKWLGTIENGLKAGANSSSLTNSTYKWSNNSRLAADPSISGAAVVGCLKDEIDGFDGFMIANAQEPFNGGNSTVTLKFNNATKAMVYAADGSVSIVNLTNNQYSVTLAAGTGCFVIPMV